jgi:hypothetical protein
MATKLRQQVVAAAPPLRRRRVRAPLAVGVSHDDIVPVAAPGHLKRGETERCTTQEQHT